MVKVNMVGKRLHLHTLQNHEDVSLPGTMKPGPYVLMENGSHDCSCVSEFAISPGSRMIHPNKSTKGSKRPAWMNKELLSLLKHKQKIHRRWKNGQATQNEYSEVVRLS